jgi:thiol:disulfide interchange protein
MSRICLSWFVMLGLLAAVQLPQVRGQVKADEVIHFDVRAVAEDPFDPTNKQGANGDFKVRRGQVVKIVLTGTPKAGYHTYPITKRTVRQKTAGQMSRLEFLKTPGVTPLWPIAETEPVPRFEETEGTLLEYVGAFTWAQDVLVSADAPTGMLTLPIQLDLYVCNVGGCVPLTQRASVSFEVTKDDPLPISEEINTRLKTPKPPIEVVTIRGEEPAPEEANVPALKAQAIKGLIRASHAEYKAKLDAIGKQIVVADGAKGPQGAADLLGFILTGIFWGAISLVTPCVFPMIPITVSFFLKQSEKEHHRPIVMASVYSLTIVIVLTLAAAFLLSVFRLLSVNPVTNYLIGGLFVFFALSLFGMYEIELPTSLAQYTSAREGKGGYAGTVFMALTFTIISFACVAPFLGGFSGTAAAARPLWHNLLGGLAFSATFASPFFFLALFPTLLRKLPKSGSWLNSVKVVMGFLELAAAFKFFRAAELVQSLGETSIFTFDIILGIWIALFVLCGLYLLGVFRLPHDSPADHISVPRLVFSVLFLGLAFYLAPALFKINAAGQPQRPAGAVYAWIDSFLLPDFQGTETEISHTPNLDYAISAAREYRKKTGKPKQVFIDFTGVGCTNCSKNEHNVFSKPSVAKLFEPYIVTKIYTDVVPTKYYDPEGKEPIADNPARSEADAKDVNLAFQKQFFGGEQLPQYVILEPEMNDKIRVVATYREGLINNVSEFSDFLKDPAQYANAKK